MPDHPKYFAVGEILVQTISARRSKHHQDPQPLLSIMWVNRYFTTLQHYGQSSENKERDSSILERRWEEHLAE